MASQLTFVRIVVQAAITGGWDWVTFTPPNGGSQVAVYEGDYTLQKLAVGWSRTPTVGVVQDMDMCTFHLLNLTSGSPDASWTDADYTDAESAFDTWWGSIGSYFPPETKLAEYLWRADGPAFRPHGAELSPTLRITGRNVAGNSSQGVPLPPQVAMSVTEVTEASFLVSGVGVPGSAPGTGRTQRRNRWGRFYLPAPTSGFLNDGRWASTILNGVADATQTLYNTLVGHDLIPVMYSPTTGNAWSIVETRIDDLCDVMRSRRYTTPTTRMPREIDTP